MTFELPLDDAVLVKEFVQGRLIELEKEINRTKNIEFRRELRKTEHALEHLVDRLAAALSSDTPQVP